MTGIWRNEPHTHSMKSDVPTPATTGAHRESSNNPARSRRASGVHLRASRPATRSTTTAKIRDADRLIIVGRIASGNRRSSGHATSDANEAVQRRFIPRMLQKKLTSMVWKPNAVNVTPGITHRIVYA